MKNCHQITTKKSLSNHNKEIENEKVPNIIFTLIDLHMFRKKGAEVPALPEPPSVEAILEDLARAGPDDVVFTVDLSDPQQLLAEVSGNNFELPKRFKVHT